MLLQKYVFVPNKTKHLNVSFFNMIAAINESKIITKRISCKCECNFRSRKCNFSQNWNKDGCRCECKNQKQHLCAKNIIFRILLHVFAKTVNSSTYY